MSTAPTDAATSTPPEPDLTPEELISRRFALEQVNEALAAASSRELITAVIVPDAHLPV